MISYHEIDFIFCLFTVILFFSVKYYLHNIWVAWFQICEVERLNRREWEKLWTRFREKEMLQNICLAKNKQTWRIAMSYMQDLNVKFQNFTFFHETLVKKKECWKRRVESRRCNISLHLLLKTWQYQLKYILKIMATNYLVGSHIWAVLIGGLHDSLRDSQMTC